VHKLLRQPWLLRLTQPGLALIARRHRLVVVGDEHLPHEGPGLLVVKHRATRDTLLLAHLLHRYAGRAANYLMKYDAAGLPTGLMTAFGAIPVLRAKDVLRLRDRAARQAALQQARTRNEAALAYVGWLYQQDELVVAYPEGMFYPDRLGPLDPGAIRHAWALARRVPRPLPIVPIGTHDETTASRRSQIIFHIGAPRDPQMFSELPALIDDIRHALKDLSDLA
jgi:1-acyl-sn-glycerol-3-phosphate acyltransferase